MNPMKSAFANTCRAHPRLFIATAAGVLAALALPSSLGILKHLLIGWNVLAWGYLMLMGWMMMRADKGKARAMAEREDEGAVLVLVIICAAAIASLAAIVFELIARKHSGSGFSGYQYLIIASTVVGSWLLVGTVFSAHYARMFYTAPPDCRPLKFPDGEQNPEYWDFLYFAFTIAAAAQTSDVLVMSRSMRKVVVSQSVLGFAFNAAILGFSINVMAGVMSA
jgi:uncharacterized membrane protein